MGIMARRAPLGVAIALLTILAWFGFGTAALACPTRIAASVEQSSPEKGCCDHKSKTCMLPPCVSACTTTIVPSASFEPVKLLASLNNGAGPVAMKQFTSGPEPPPPRVAAP